MREVLDGATEVDGLRDVRLSGTYNRYTPLNCPRQWHRMNFDEWTFIKRNPHDRASFLARLAHRIANSGMELTWLTPRYVQDNDGKKWAYWKAVRP